MHFIYFYVQEVLFEAYVQYREYQGFETAMNALRNMKWVKKIDGKTFQANVKVGIFYLFICYNGEGH